MTTPTGLAVLRLDAQIAAAAVRARSIAAARLCHRWSIPPQAVVRRPDGVWLEPVGVPLDAALGRPWLLEGWWLAVSLCTRAGARLAPRGRDEATVSIAALALVAQSTEDLFTLDEVFTRGVYDWTPGAPVVVLDIGMNVAFAALRMACLPAVTAVYGFEPFAPTFEQGVRNLRLNPAVATRVQAVNRGVAAQASVRHLAYDPARRGSAGLFGTAPHPRAAAGAETIELLPAVDVVDDTRARHPEAELVAKIDCEGAEYEIVDALATAGRLRHLSRLMIEWHRLAPDHDPAALAGVLSNAGFDVSLSGATTDPAGMLYANRR